MIAPWASTLCGYARHTCQRCRLCCFQCRPCHWHALYAMCGDVGMALMDLKGICLSLNKAVPL